MSRAGILEWRSAVLKSGLPRPVESTALILATHSEDNGIVSVTERRLAVEGCRSRSAVWKHLRVLEHRGLIRRAARVGQRRTSVYMLQLPPG